MVHDVIATCPVCSGELTIARLHAAAAAPRWRENSEVGRFGRLDASSSACGEFLRSRGNLKEMERELGISYPTFADGWTPSSVRSSCGRRRRRRGREFGAGFADDFADQPEGGDVAAERRAILERLPARR